MSEKIDRRTALGAMMGMAGMAVTGFAQDDNAASTGRVRSAQRTGGRAMSVKGFPQITHEVDFAVIGGGMAGFCAALAAARRGVKVLLMHDRPVLGGNASSECRMHICGADRHNGIPNMRETGILEEIRLDNLYRNPNRNFSIWDTLLYEKVMVESNITLLLNCSCLDADVRGHAIRSVTGWQLTTQTHHKVKAKIFADCSGDAILAPATGAEFRMGREAKAEFGESIAPDVADERTMGMTCLFQSREYDHSQPFEPPTWAYRFDSCTDLPYGEKGHRWWEMGHWWIELGGEHHSIHDTELLRDELLKITYGVWDHVKNRCPNRKAAENWALEWIQFLPAKRESRRYMGEHILTQNDIESEGRFEDLVAYGGWSMDDHHPAGFRAVKLGAPATIFHKAPSPYGIPLRCLYSRNIKNLMFAGRDASTTHAAMSSTRVMGTGCSMGQAVGAAAALSIQKGIWPGETESHIQEIQRILQEDDAYLPGIPHTLSELTTSARLTASQGDPEPVRDGISRPVGQETHAWTGQSGDWLLYAWDDPQQVTEVSLCLDSALDRALTMSYHQKDSQLREVPDVMPKKMRIEARVEGTWRPVLETENNHQRHVRVKVGIPCTAVRFTLEETWGAEKSRIYAFTVS